MNTQTNTRTVQDFEGQNVHAIPEGTKPGETDTAFEPIGDVQSDAALIRLGCRLEASFGREQILGKVVLADENADDVDLEAQIQVSRETVDSILSIRATTAAGLAVKLRAWMWAMNDYTAAEVATESEATTYKLMASVCADAMALQSGTAFVPPSTFDQPLIEAWAEHQRICAELIALREKAEALEESTRPLLPGVPEALFVREGEFGGTIGGDAKAFLTIEGRALYPVTIIEWLRKLTPNLASPDAERAAEIVKAHDDTIAAAEEIRKQTGLAAALAAVEEAEDRLNAIADKMLDIPALSLRGIGLKASWALTHTAKGESDISGVLRQVEAFARRHAYGDMPDVPRIERMVMGGMPAADWHLYRMFTKWFESASAVRALETQYDSASQAGQDEAVATSIAAALEQEYTREWAFRKAVRDTRAASIQGVQLKAIVYAWLCRSDDEMRKNEHDHGGGIGSVSDTAFAFNIAREMAMVGVPGVLDTGAEPEAKPDRRAMESYRTWLQNEFTSLTYEMYPGMPQMLGAISVNNAGDRFHFRGEPPASSRAERILDMFALDWRADDSLFADRLGEKAA